MRVLLVEDEEPIANVIRRGLEEHRFHVTIVHSGTEGLRLACAEEFSLVILDLMLPGMDGWAVCSELRRRRIRTPILMLTARDAVEDRVKGLDLGADDYLPKPFAFTELLARVRALIRRERVHKGSIIRVDDLEIDTAAGVARRGGRELHLTRREFTLLESLAANEGRVLSREVILERVWMDSEAFSNTVDVHIGTLRKKLDAGDAPRLIHTVHGLGYTLRAPGTPEEPR